MIRDTLRAVFTADERLDDVTRARIWSRIDARLAEPAPRRIPRAGIACAVAAAAIAAFVGLRSGAHHDETTLAAPADSVLATRLGPHAPATLVGPASLAIVGPAGDATHVRLDRGALYAEFEGGPGRSLQIDAPGATITVVGTELSVEVGATTCVSVAHGRVRVDAAGEQYFVGTGERWCTGDATPSALDARALERIDRYMSIRTAAAAPVPASASATVPASAAVPAAAAVAAAVPAAAAVAAPAVVPVTATVTAAAAVHAPTTTTTPTSTSPSPSPSPSMSTTTTTTTNTSTPTSLSPAPEPHAQAEQRYEAAEAALGRGDAAGADNLLAALVADAPDSPLAAEATFDRARIAFERRAWTDARARLDALALFHDAALAEPADYLRCRVAVQSHDRTATTCLEIYHDTYPRGPHDVDVLGLIAQRAAEADGCDGARAAIDELARIYPTAALTRAWLARCPTTR